MERYSEPLTRHKHPPGGSLASGARLVEKPLGQVEMSHKAFITAAPFSVSLACCCGAGSPPSHTRRRPCPPPPGGPAGLILHTHPPARMPWEFLQPPGPTHTPNWGIPNNELSPLSLSFPVLRMRAVTFTFEGSSMRPWGKCETACLTPTPVLHCYLFICFWPCWASVAEEGLFAAVCRLLTAGTSLAADLGLLGMWASEAMAPGL